MIIETKRQIPAQPAHETIAHHLKCDCCGAESNDSRGWNDRRFDSDEVTVTRMHREMYPECGNAEGVAWDFCPKCFDEKVRPLLETIAKPRKVDESW